MRTGINTGPTAFTPTIILSEGNGIGDPRENPVLNSFIIPAKTSSKVFDGWKQETRLNPNLDLDANEENSVGFLRKLSASLEYINPANLLYGAADKLEDLSEHLLKKDHYRLGKSIEDLVERSKDFMRANYFNPRLDETNFRNLRELANESKDLVVTCASKYIKENDTRKRVIDCSRALAA